jgi:hypothetical protein
MVLLLMFVSVSCVASEFSWSNRETISGPMRQIIGLPSFAVGNLNPSARNPGLEIFCTSILDSPGGYCYYWTSGVPYINSTIFGNVTLGGNK